MVVASPPSPLPLPVGVVPTIVSPPPPPPPRVPTPVPQPLATVVPIISVVTAPPDTPMEAPPQVLDSQTHQVEVLSLSTVLTFVKLNALGCYYFKSLGFLHCFYGSRYVFEKEDRREIVQAEDYIMAFVENH